MDFLQHRLGVLFLSSISQQYLILQRESAELIAVSSFSTSGSSVSAFYRLKQKISRLWSCLLQRWPSMLPLAREFLLLFLRANLMFFYFEGLYYHISKRAAGIRYVSIGKPMNQRPRYQILGIFLLVQLYILATERLRRSNLSSIASSVQHASLVDQHTSTGGG